MKTLYSTGGELEPQKESASVEPPQRRTWRHSQADMEPSLGQPHLLQPQINHVSAEVQLGLPEEDEELDTDDCSDEEDAV